MKKSVRLEIMEARIARIEKARIEKYEKKKEKERKEKERIEIMEAIIETERKEKERINIEIIEKEILEKEMKEKVMIEEVTKAKERINKEIIEKEISARKFQIKMGYINPKMENLILKIEIVPLKSKRINLSSGNVCTPQEWADLAQKKKVDAGCKCEICGAEGKFNEQKSCYDLNCHETWFYDDEMHFQYLKNLITLCDLCHHVKHIRRAEHDVKDVKEHFIKVNNYLFSWGEITGNDRNRLTDFLRSKYDLEWVKEAKISKTNSDKTIMLTAGENFISMNLNDDDTELNLKIDSSKTDKFIVKSEKHKLNIYVNNCSPETYEEHLNDAEREFERRRDIDWKIHFGEYAVLLPSVRAYMEAHGFKNNLKT